MCSWGKLWTKRPKSPTATSEEPGAKAGGQEQKQGTVHAPCTQHHQRGGQSTKATPPAQPLDPPLPSPHGRNQLIRPPFGKQVGKGTCCLFSVRGPNKALPEFLVWPLINF